MRKAHVLFFLSLMLLSFQFLGQFLGQFSGLFIGSLSTPVYALPLNSADPSARGPEGTILAIKPPLSFDVDARLKRNVEFWVGIYTQYSSTQGLIHDSKYIDRVYEVVDLLRGNSQSSKLVRESKKKWKNVLLSLHRKQNNLGVLSEDERKVFDLFKDINEPNKFLKAAHRKRLRFQLGQKDNFKDGLYHSGRFMSEMEQIFKKEGMPRELTRLPFVESSFNFRARSKVGASGVWQFMRSTGRTFLTVNEALDERNDPLRATEAAAKLLKLNYESLGSWPLAVTAYNHGRKGMMRAVRRVGSEELEDVVSDYHSRSFGFASGNFFTELLAAIEVERNSEKYFGKLEKAKPLQFVEVRIPDFIDFHTLIRGLKVEAKTIVDLNPALTDSVYSGKLLVPKGYLMRFPRGLELDKEQALKDYLDKYKEIPDSSKRKAQLDIKYGTKVKSVKHRIKRRSNSTQGKSLTGAI